MKQSSFQVRETRTLLERLPLWANRRQRRRVKRARTLLERLYPVSTNKELIRFGPNSDGGYLIPNDLEGIQACFSPGVSDISGFEKACAELGINVFLADGSVDGPADEHKLFHFTKKYIGETTGNGFMTLDDWVASSIDDQAADLLLQIDIEGDEYEVFRTLSETVLQRFRIIVAEFHWLEELLGERSVEVSSVFNKILQHHACVHIHPNNCGGYLVLNGLDIPNVMEFTFLRRDRISHSSYQTIFPHPLDCDNSPNPPIILPNCWYGSEA
ncbi:MAG: FkbM family methyltransferase [Chloroflexota bacterium]